MNTETLFKRKLNKKKILNFVYNIYGCVNLHCKCKITVITNTYNIQKDFACNMRGCLYSINFKFMLLNMFYLQYA